jgi:ABC-type multidrug transport system fused ATPase/permease subunit
MAVVKTFHSSAKPQGTDFYLERSGAFSVKVWSILGRFLRIALEHPKLMGRGVFCMLISSTCIIVGPRLLGSIVDSLSTGSKQVGTSLLFLLILIEALQFFSVVGQTFYFSALGQELMQTIRVRLFSHFLRLPLPTIDKTPHGALVTRLTTDVSYLADMFQTAFVEVAKDSLVVVVAFIGMAVLDLPLTMMVAVGFFGLFLFAKKLTPSLFRAHREVRITTSGINALLSDIFANPRVFHGQALQGLFTGRGMWLSSAVAEANLSRIKASALLHPATTIVTGIAVVVLFMSGSYWVGEGVTTPGKVTAFLTYLLMIFWPIVHTTNRLDMFLSGVASLERIFDALDWELEPEDSDVPSVTVISGEIEFRDVWFAYTTDEWVLRGVSFRIPKGTHVGIVGTTGSGKSTLVSLLLRFYTPQRGDILIDGISIFSIPRRQLREAIGIVHQDPFIFPGTVEENISLWSHSDEQKLKDILGAEALSILSRVDGEIEGGGKALSAGMRQLISFARNLYRTPKVWVLDEATAHLDPELDQQLNDLLAEHAVDATAFVIAHRLSSVENCDLILVLSNGQLVEQGTSAQLIASNGLFARMHRAQLEMSRNASLSSVPA